jgi:Arc/MetJ family transcription regulator
MYNMMTTRLIKVLNIMRTTINIDDNLLQKAQHITGVTEKTALVREGLRALVERESAHRLARLGGSEPQLEPIPRRQSKES